MHQMLPSRNRISSLSTLSTIFNIVVAVHVINFNYFHLQDEFCAAVDDLKTRERTSNEKNIKEINYDCPETEQLYGIGYHKVIQIKHSYIYLHWVHQFGWLTLVVLSSVVALRCIVTIDMIQLGLLFWLFWSTLTVFDCRCTRIVKTTLSSTNLMSISPSASMRIIHVSNKVFLSKDQILIVPVIELSINY